MPAPASTQIRESTQTTESTQTRESNAVLLRAVGEGEPPAWEELISRYGRLVRSTVASFRLQEADAEDAVQNTWLRLMERMDTIRDPRCLGGWLATTASRECLALIRRGHREAPDDAAAEQLVAVDPGPETAVVVDADRSAVNAAVRELPGARQLLIHALFYQPECSYAEVSHVTGMPQGSIGPTRRRALRELRYALEQRGFGPQSGAA
jgi:RNA polymerase sigma factor (sigma-70 family)